MTKICQATISCNTISPPGEEYVCEVFTRKGNMPRCPLFMSLNFLRRVHGHGISGCRGVAVESIGHAAVCVHCQSCPIETFMLTSARSAAASRGTDTLQRHATSRTRT